MSEDDEVIRRRVFTISVASFIIMLGAGIVVPILPKYAESFGVSYTVVGLTISAFGFARIISDIPSGTISDRIGRRMGILVGTLLFASTGVLAAYASDINHLIAARFIQGVGAAIFTTSSLAYLADMLPEANRGRYLGYYQGSFFLGSAIGPSIGGLLTSIGGLKLPFLTLSALSLVGAWTTYTSLAKPTVREKDAGTQKTGAKSMFVGMLRSRNMLIASISASTTFILVTSVRFTILPIYGDKVLSLGEVEIGAVLSLMALINALMMRWTGPLTDGLGPSSTLLYGFTFSGLATALYALAFNLPMLVIATIAFGAATSLTMPAQIAIIVDSSDAKHRGLFIGVYRVFSDVGLMVFMPISYIFYFMGSVSVAAALLIMLIRGSGGWRREPSGVG